MADNYLENQYEQYLARKAAWEQQRKYGKKPTNNNSQNKPKPTSNVTNVDKTMEKTSPLPEE